VVDQFVRLLREVRDPVYLLDGEGRVVFHNGRLPPGVGPSEAEQFNGRVPEPLRVPLPLGSTEASTERIRYRDALHHAHVVRRRLVPLDDRWACILMTESNPEEATRLEFLGRLVLHVAHDLNNMLTAIVGHADLLGSSFEQGAPEREWIANLRLASRQAARFSHRLLVFGHGGPAQPRKVELNEHVADLARTIRRLLPHETRFEFQPAVGEVHANIDPHHLDQALLALAAGLQDVLAPGGAIHLRVTTDPGVSLRADSLRSPDLDPSFGALEFARKLVEVEVPEPGTYLLTPIA
jgi:signal transduction histidine kinase